MPRARLFMREAGDDDFVEFGVVQVAVDHHEDKGELGLLMVNGRHKNKKKKHVFFPFLPDNNYKRTTDTCIEWRQSTPPADYCYLAAHFLSENSCSYIWAIISCVQREWHANNHEGSVYSRSASCDLMELPPVDLSSLPLLLKMILECNFSDKRRIAKLIAQDTEFFLKLSGLSRTLEDSASIDGLHLIYQLVRGIILLSNHSVFDQMLSDEIVRNTIGALEYNPENPKAENHRISYENDLKKDVIFRKALPVENNAVFTNLHQSYGAFYILDVMLPNLDEVAIASLKLYAHTKSTMVRWFLEDDLCFTQELFAKLKSDCISPGSKVDLVFVLV
ncbi:hypothetical protein LUZ63_009813 [Rhynchospora breviuscula]|uniref:Serine/threonine-protein phosphatase 4 regulatory subunit 3-like central domain-containing protein n=1 Tax=Rhynchospora breviuscula TaxID=2022672 RepID=A0A9Q0CFW9_9POAL|nr:hypothetical protein LUZ63_009813 [Rhynchospora breviuscula]